MGGGGGVACKFTDEDKLAETCRLLEFASVKGHVTGGRWWGGCWWVGPLSQTKHSIHYMHKSIYHCTQFIHKILFVHVSERRTIIDGLVYMHCPASQLEHFFCPWVWCSGYLAGIQSPNGLVFCNIHSIECKILPTGK